MAFQFTIFVTAASGHIGSRLVPLLLRDRVKLILPTSNAARLKSQLSTEPSGTKIEIEEGSVKDHIWLERILKQHNVDTVFLCFSGYDELIVTLNFLDVMQRVGAVKHLVYVSAAGEFVSEKGLQHALSLHTAAHVITKPIIERKLQYGNYPWTTTVLGSTMFFENDLRSKDSMLNDEFFDEPLGEIGVSRVSPMDKAIVARNTLIDQQRWAEVKINIGTRHKFTGSEVAKLWSEALERSVRMCKSDEKGLEQFEALMNKKVTRLGEMGKAWARDLRHMYDALSRDGIGLSDEDYELLVEC